MSLTAWLGSESGEEARCDGTGMEKTPLSSSCSCHRRRSASARHGKIHPCVLPLLHRDPTQHFHKCLF